MDTPTLPAIIEDVEALEALLSHPTPELIESVSKLNGDITILGVGGKMGPTLARLLKNTINASGKNYRVIGVDRFHEGSERVRQMIEDNGIETVTCEMLEWDQLDALEKTPNVIYMAGFKFGSAQNEALTWAINTYLPGMVVQAFRGSRITALSSGNIYPFIPPSHGGSRETDPVAPIGEYAQSTLGRERIFSYWSGATETPVTLVRLNYAAELRYGVLLDIAETVYRGEPVDVTMGAMNCIWQGDANTAIIQSLELAEAPPRVLNLTGPETLSLRRVAGEFGRLFDLEAEYTGEEAETALLNNAADCFKLYGLPKVNAYRIMEWIAHWVKKGNPTLSKPTHFQTRNGKF
jgi:nucleoside-diphosphate-sugar epimerase